MHDLTNVRAQWDAMHDVPGGVASSVLVYERLHHALAIAKRRPLAVTVLFVAWERALGAQCDPRALDAQVAERVSTSVRTTDTVGWLVPDQLCVLFPNAEDADVPTVAGRLMLNLMRPFETPAGEVILRPSGGVTVATRGDVDATVEELARQADVALRDAQSRGGGFVAYDIEAARSLVMSIQSSAA